MRLPKISDLDFHSACRKTVEGWDGDKLIRFAADQLYYQHKDVKFAVLDSTGEVRSGMNTAENAYNLAKHSPECVAVEIDRENPTYLS